MFHYVAFGLTIRADISLPGLVEVSSRAPDVEVMRNVNPSLPLDLGQAPFEFSADRQVLTWPEVARFEIIGTNQVTYEMAPGASPDLISFPLLGPVFGLLLHLRGNLVLHASAIEMDGIGVIMLGDKGAGKSTTAATFVAHGDKLLSDDVVVLAYDAVGNLQILPSFAQIKLTESAREILRPLGEVERHPLIGKYVFQLPERATTQGTRPGIAVVLLRSETFAIEHLSSADALKELLRYSYASRFDLTELPRQVAASHLSMCAALIKTARVARMCVPAGIGRLGEARPMLIENMT